MSIAHPLPGGVSTQVDGVGSNGVGLFTLHGFLGTPADWKFLENTLSNTHIKSVDLLDLIPDPRQILHKKLTKISQNTPVFLMGYSMGARLALHYALTYPNTLSGLILESSSPGIRNKTERESRAKSDASLAKKILNTPRAEFLSDWYQQPLFDSLRNHPNFQSLLDSRRTGPEQAQLLQALSVGNQPSLWKKLPELNIPTLLITGESDSRYTQITAKMAQKIPRSTWIQLPNTGHNCHFENPEMMAQAVRKFLIDCLKHDV